MSFVLGEVKDYFKFKQDRRLHYPNADGVLGNYPPFVYKFEYVSEVKENKIGLFNLQKLPPQWFYFLTFLNTSKSTAKHVNLSFKLKRQASAIFIKPVGCDIFLQPAQKIPQDNYTLAVIYSDNFTAMIDNLSPGISGACWIVLFMDQRPSADEFLINIQSEEGPFERITPNQWGNIDWQNGWVNVVLNPPK